MSAFSKSAPKVGQNPRYPCAFVVVMLFKPKHQIYQLWSIKIITLLHKDQGWKMGDQVQYARSHTHLTFSLSFTHYIPNTHSIHVTFTPSPRYMHSIQSRFLANLIVYLVKPYNDVIEQNKINIHNYCQQ